MSRKRSLGRKTCKKKRLRSAEKKLFGSSGMTGDASIKNRIFETKAGLLIE